MEKKTAKQPKSTKAKDVSLKDLQLSDIKIPSLNIGGFFDRFHAVIFTVTVFGGLSVAVFMLSMLLNENPDDFVPSNIETAFDDQIIDRVNSLRPLDQPAPRSPGFPEGRIAPF